MAKKRFGRPKRADVLAVTSGVQDALRPDELEEMLQAGDGLFWQRHGDDIKLYSPDVVSIGVEAMWDLWERINDLIPATNGSVNGPAVSTWS
ncbi:MAG: hypothetical protein WBO55_02635 [Rhizobiaceae bacterium]|nr:hypothetical protein [bacterium]